MRRLSPKATIWREAAQLQQNHRQRFYASRAGAQLVVSLCVVQHERGRVEASVEREHDGERRAKATSWRIANLSDRRNVSETIRFAKVWAEKQADELRDARGAE